MKWVLSVSFGFYRGAIDMQCYNDLPKVTSVADGIELKQYVSRVFTTTP